MTTFWHKPAYTALDRDPVTKAILPGAIPPGIYCEDEEAFGKLRSAARLRGQAVTAGVDVVGGTSWFLQGQAVFIATPEQARLLRAVATDAPEPASEPSYEEVVAEQVAAEKKAARATLLQAWKAWLATDPPEAPRPTGHPAQVANRAQLRAAGARARRRA